MKAHTIRRTLGALLSVGLLVAALLLSVAPARATSNQPQVTFGEPWSIFDTSVDVMGTNGVQPNVNGMNAVFDVNFANLANRRVALMVCFYDQDYRPLYASYDIYNTPQGYPYRSQSNNACAPYLITVPNTPLYGQLPQEIGMPYDELHLPVGRHVLYYRVTATDMYTLKALGSSSFERFTMTVN